MFGKKKPDQSLTPPPRSTRSNAREVLRLWELRGEGQDVTLLPDAFSDANGRVDPGVWGLALVDIARHVAKAYQQALGADPQVVLGRIRAGFDAEWNHPTNEPSGTIQS